MFDFIRKIFAPPATPLAKNKPAGPKKNIGNTGLTAQVMVREPNEDEIKIRELSKKATELSTVDLDAAIECLRRVNVLMQQPNTPDYPQKQFERLPKYLLRAGRTMEAEAEFEAIHQMIKKRYRDNYNGQLERGRRARQSHPYFLLERGPSLNPCPIHDKNTHVILSVDDDYWTQYPMREHPECKCRIRGVSIREYERLKENGGYKFKIA